MKDDAQMLPGFDLETVVSRSQDLEDLSEEKAYTAERLLVSHPDRYNIARGLFFELGLSKRAICELCKLNSRTLNALIERELNTHGADFLYERIRRKKALIAYQLTEQLEELAQDSNACKEVGINGLINAIKLIQASAGQTIDVKSASSNTSDDNPEVIDYVRVYKLSDSKSNGLDLEKNLAPRDRSSATDGKIEEASDNGDHPDASFRHDNSILPSNVRKCSTIAKRMSTANAKSFHNSSH